MSNIDKTDNGPLCALTGDAARDAARRHDVSLAIQYHRLITRELQGQKAERYAMNRAKELRRGAT